MKNQPRSQGANSRHGTAVSAAFVVACLLSSCAGLHHYKSRADFCDRHPEHVMCKVNAAVNSQIEYAHDWHLYPIENGGDYWTYNVEKGDCEDYALTKMQLLAEQGIASRLVIVTHQYNIMLTSVHAVLAVEHGGTWWALDNFHDEIRPLKSYDGGKAFL